MNKPLISLTITAMLSFFCLAPAGATGIEVDAPKFPSAKSFTQKTRNPIKFNIGEIPALTEGVPTWREINQPDFLDNWQQKHSGSQSDRIAAILKEKARIAEEVRSQLEQRFAQIEKQLSHLKDLGYDIEGKLPDLDNYPQLNAPLAAVPIPASAWLLLSGIGALGWVGRRRRAAAT